MNNETKYNALIVDDEYYARNDLKELLAEFPSINLVGQADSVSSAIDAINQYKPDLIFLDIQFPGETGFDLIPNIDNRIKIIFVTAYNEFAIRAFDVNACDYLLKPINPERLSLAIERLHINVKSPENPKNELLITDSIYLQLNYKHHFVRVDSIIRIASSGHYTEVVTSKGLKGLTTKRLCEWESLLPKEHFIKVHRTAIINHNFIERIEKGPNYSFHILMKNCEGPIPISRKYFGLIKKRTVL